MNINKYIIERENQVNICRIEEGKIIIDNFRSQHAGKKHTNSTKRLNQLIEINHTRNHQIANSTLGKNILEIYELHDLNPTMLYGKEYWFTRQISNIARNTYVPPPEKSQMIPQMVPINQESNQQYTT